MSMKIWMWINILTNIMKIKSCNYRLISNIDIKFFHFWKVKILGETLICGWTTHDMKRIKMNCHCLSLSNLLLNVDSWCCYKLQAVFQKNGNIFFRTTVQKATTSEQSKKIALVNFYTPNVLCLPSQPPPMVVNLLPHFRYFHQYFYQWVSFEFWYPCEEENLFYEI